MKRLISAVLLLIAVGVTGCVGNQEPMTSGVVEGSAVVVDIESRRWKTTWGGIYTGDSVIVFKVSNPAKYEGREVILGVESPQELEVGGQRLVKGSRLLFRAGEEVFYGDTLLPGVFRVHIRDIRTID